MSVDAPMHDAPPPAEQPAKRRKPPPPEEVTIREHDWTYLNLQILSDPSNTTTSSSSTDILTWRTTLTSALTQFLGITGSAIQIDILHLSGDEAWLRVPRENAKKFQAAVGGYVGSRDGRSVGFRTRGTGEFLMGVVSKQAQEGLWDE
ncbi:hypothetical protein BZA05DRAFT_446383 [Tricharina praecox]|uniref:uncharacterized protein n=1 Tax=Tricharina praecox TaxID=43433 RepID=UPI0022203F3B|nr:uncharacterized protein BZA05DRAFT_446383 [Tricharina praecox]KAI5848855.1 hypothetical protein BZA05DRAFT_446383 [Tricharina praecox]